MDTIGIVNGQLKNTSNNELFTPRGVNYVEVNTDPSGNIYHSAFEPGQYNAKAAQSMLNSLKTNGYNTVRWFVDPGEFTNPSHGISTGANSVAPINRAYMSNVIDFVKQAAADGIYSIPVIDNVPPNTFYQDIIGPLPADIAPANAPYLDPKYVVAKETYLRRFVGSLLRGIGKQNAGDILPIDTDNQVEFDAS